MGKISQGIWGGFSGKVGPVVGSRWRNICYIRSLAARVSNPNTARQRCQRGKFRTVVGFLKTILPYIQIGFSGYEQNKSAYNAAVSYLMCHAFTGSGEDAGLDFGKVRVSRGSLTPAAGASVSRQGGRVVFTWSDNSGEGDAAADDVALLLVYNKKRGDAIYSLSGTARSDCEASLPLPRGWEADELVVFLSFRSSDGRRVSNSICLNEGILVTFSEDSPVSVVSGGAMWNGQWRLVSALQSPVSAVNGLLTRRTPLFAAVQWVEARGHPVAAGGRPPLG